MNTTEAISLADLQTESSIMPDRQIVPGLFKEIEVTWLLTDI